MRVNRRFLALTVAEIGDAPMLDIRFDGHRVWSISTPEAVEGVVRIAWPAPIRARLRGAGVVTVHDTAHGQLLATRSGRFGWSRGRVSFTDARGQRLAMTKWDRLGPIISGGDSDVAARLIVSARRLSDDLQQWGYPVYLVGGTLLGMVRGGELLPHDDDIDFAFLADSDDPAELGRISYDMERRLTDAGYTVARHSLAHLELVFFDEAGQVDHYIDIFTGFFHEGQYCQPFALRSDAVTRTDLVPTRDIQVGGTALPAPADPEAWLAYAYGPNWRTPDPTFTFEIDSNTKSRFESWFGVFNRGRFFWEKHWQGLDSGTGSAGGERAVRLLMERMPPGSCVLDLGCGDATWAQRIAAAGHRVVAVDFSFEALRVAQAQNRQGIDLRRININDRAQLLALGADTVATGETWYVLCHDVLHGLTHPGRENVLLLVNMVLRAGGLAVVSFDTHRTSRYRRGDPRTWHHPESKFCAEIAENGLAVGAMSRTVRRSAVGWRRSTTAVIDRAGRLPHERETWRAERDEDAR